MLLSFQSNEQVQSLYAKRKLDRPTRNTIGTIAGLQQELQTVRKRGWAEDVEETLLGLYCIAAPVFGPDKAPVAALSISAPAVRVTPGFRPKLARIIVAGAQHISEIIGSNGAALS